MKRFLKYFNVFLLVVLVGSLIYGFTNSRQILDFLALRGYEPPTKIVELASSTTMNDKTRKVFYVNQPELQNKQQFHNSCTQREQTIVLGCYVSNDGIYLLNVADKRLEGVIEVTAAHEILHAMYDRLSEGERTKVDQMTGEFYKTVNNDRIKQNVENYRKNDASVVPNELHSILATEVRDLSPELEEYYSKYFINRKAIVVFSEKYEQTFIDIENQAKAYDIQLKTLKPEIESMQKQVDNLDAQIDSERSELDALLSSRQVDAYNAKVASYNNLIKQYNNLVRELQSKINQFNSIVEQYNMLEGTKADLLQSLKTDNLQPIGGVN